MLTPRCTSSSLRYRKIVCRVFIHSLILNICPSSGGVVRGGCCPGGVVRGVLSGGKCPFPMGSRYMIRKTEILFLASYTKTYTNTNIISLLWSMDKCQRFMLVAV